MNARWQGNLVQDFIFLRETSNMSRRATLEKICQFEKLNFQLKPRVQKGILR